MIQLKMANYVHLLIGTNFRFPDILQWWRSGVRATDILNNCTLGAMIARNLWLLGRGRFTTRIRVALGVAAPSAWVLRRNCILALVFGALLIVWTSPEVGAEGGSKTDAGVGKVKSATQPDGADPQSLELSLDQAMWAALAFENATKLKDVLKRGADPNKPDKLSQMTPLMAAETARMAEILLEAGADPNQKDRIGQTALHHAVKMRDAGSIVRLLGQAGADVDAPAENIGGCTPLLVAVEHYFEDKDQEETALAIRILIHLGANIEAEDNSGRTALALAAEGNQPKLIRLLIDLGADPNRPLVNGRTPLDYARDANAEDAIQALAAAPSKQPPAN